MSSRSYHPVPSRREDMNQMTRERQSRRYASGLQKNMYKATHRRSACEDLTFHGLLDPHQENLGEGTEEWMSLMMPCKCPTLRSAYSEDNRTEDRVCVCVTAIVSFTRTAGASSTMTAGGGGGGGVLTAMGSPIGTTGGGGGV
ncbi:hypothetical protein SISSUDRAFT_837554 [Sistotremastrum suecicum HHB10207 ss-3]|uniref:Uncharacterized protein n=1 Tax=Sistotremastrum suecicum HHB10207 ss-3 TaxID=1314776 RepID=A0A166CL18_9AGAM|nr:hypothetical protein SISSUDRAFT_837554 [Sistotremastrum suecicum HHB10207 ss-3]